MRRAPSTGRSAALPQLLSPRVTASTDPSSDPSSDCGIAHRLDALELKAMDAELAQATLDDVVVRHASEIAALQRALQALTERVDGLPAQASAGDGGQDSVEGSLSEALARERPPHY